MDQVGCRIDPRLLGCGEMAVEHDLLLHHLPPCAHLSQQPRQGLVQGALWGQPRLHVFGLIGIQLPGQIGPIWIVRKGMGRIGWQGRVDQGLGQTLQTGQGLTQGHRHLAG